MKSQTFTPSLPLILIGSLYDNNYNSFIAFPSKELISFRIEESVQTFAINAQNQNTTINFDQTQNLIQPYANYKFALDIFFTHIFKVQTIPRLIITTDSELNCYTFGALLIATLQALSQFYSLKLDNPQTLEILKTIYSKFKHPPTDFFVQTLSSLLNQAFYFDHNQQTYQTLDLSPFHLNISDLKQTLNSDICPDFSQDKKYQKDITQIRKRISFLASQAAKAITQKAKVQLGENLTKNQKALNQLGFNSEETHELLIQSILDGDYGGKIISLEKKLYFVTLSNKKFGY